MANHTAARSVHKTLGAGAQDVITLTATASIVEILNRGDDTIFGTSGSTPALNVPDAVVAGDDTFAIPPGGSRTLLIAQQDTDLVVKLIAAQVTAYSVQIGGQ